MAQDYNVSRPTAEMADYPHGMPPPSGALPREAVASFIANGYAVLRGFYDKKRVESLRAAMGELLRRAVEERLPDVGVDRWLSAEGEALRSSLGAAAPTPDELNPHRVTYIDNLHKHHPLLDAHLRCPKLLTALSELLGEDIDAFQCATSTKPNDWDGEDHGWHQVPPPYPSAPCPLALAAQLLSAPLPPRSRC